MDITLDRGRGYVSAEQNKNQLQPVIGVIPIDSIYTPVLKCNYTVENTRVGQRTDYEKLIIEIWTDGTISAKEAVSYAAKILKDFRSLRSFPMKPILRSLWKRARKAARTRFSK